MKSKPFLTAIPFLKTFSSSQLLSQKVEIPRALKIVAGTQADYKILTSDNSGLT